jgi:tRNA(fMet)-specific endonuclease VapC
MRILLDSNAYSAMVRGQIEVTDRIREAEEMLLSIVVMGELLYGFHNGSRYRENRRILDEFLTHPNVRVVTLTPTTAERFGEIFTSLRRKGRPIPTNDIWIAAQAIETDCGLLSSDPHFEAIEGLSWIRFPAL